jgi:hypothetical protein
MAEAERRGDVAVNVAAAVAAARAVIESSSLDDSQPPAAEAPADRQQSASVTPAARPVAVADREGGSESHRIKLRMMDASRARRSERSELVTESTDPVLPDWYEPDLDDAEGATGSAGDSPTRR